MRILLWVLGLAAFAFVALGAYVRLAPSDPADWHVDPFTSSPPEGKSHVLLGQDASDRSLIFEAIQPAALLQRIDRRAQREPRTTVLAGSPADGRVTYITRSRLWGFPDYTTVAARPDGDGAAMAILARQRFGSKDLGVNAARVARWLEGLDQH